MLKEVIYGVLPPFLGTTLGSGCVLVTKKKLNLMVRRGLTGFAAGAMTAA